jgi:hypothetical protein
MLIDNKVIVKFDSLYGPFLKEGQTPSKIIEGKVYHKYCYFAIEKYA